MSGVLISIIVGVSEGGDLVRTLRTLDAYRRETSVSHELLVGESFASALERAKGEFVHVSSDMVEPHPGWWQPALAVAKTDAIAAPMLWLPTGEPVSPTTPHDWATVGITLLPFLKKKLIPPAVDHDDGLRRRSLDLPVRFRMDYAFTCWGDPEAIGRL